MRVSSCDPRLLGVRGDRGFSACASRAVILVCSVCGAIEGSSHARLEL